MSEGVVLHLRTTKHMRSAIREMAAELHRLGVIDNESMSDYVRKAVKDRLQEDRLNIEKQQHI